MYILCCCVIENWIKETLKQKMLYFLFWNQLNQKFKRLSELATSIDIGNPFFNWKVKKLNKKLLELKTAIFGAKNKNLFN